MFYYQIWIKNSFIVWLISIAHLSSLCLASVSIGAIEDKNVETRSVELVAGDIARLPCFIDPEHTAKISLIIWYKDDMTKPIYSFDARSNSVEDATHWAEDAILNGRGHFELKSDPPTLSIGSIKSSDAGLYRCRVDFKKSPTRNTKVNLTVITPPDNIKILDERENSISDYRLGPYNEGSSINLTCISNGGHPPPRLIWWHENTILDDSYHSTNFTRVVNVLQIQNLQRHHLGAVLTCESSNNNITTPLSSSIHLDMNLRPLWVKLQGENRPLSAGKMYSLWCEVVGTKPAPTITWWKGSILMKNSTDSPSADGNTTISKLDFTPTIDDGGKYLSCRGEQPLIPESGLESGWKLDIHHVPVVSLELGSNVNTTVIREGADVYFECNIKSNPWVYRVNWRHNGKELYNNFQLGIIVANQSLVLQNITRARSGIYTCIGSNEEGDGESNPVQLDIKFAPLCRPGQNLIYNVARQEQAKIVCELEANPYDVNFTWKFNISSSEALDLPASLIIVDRTKSIAHYTPMTEQDYGTLLCWGSNDMGVQTEPCVYTIVPAGKPDPLTNCTVSNQTKNVLQLECIEGFDGGLTQTFDAEVFYAHTKNLVMNVTSSVPFFLIRGLRPEYGYDIVLTAKNPKGRSTGFIHHVYTLNGAEKHTEVFPSFDFILPYTGNTLHMKLLLGAIAGLVFGIMLILLSTILIVRFRRTKNHCTISATSESSQDGLNMDRYPYPSNSIVGTGCPTLAGHYQHHVNRTINDTDSCDSLDKNPDIIPLGKDENNVEEETAFRWPSNTSYATAAMANQCGMKTLPYTTTTHSIPNPAAAVAQMYHHYGIIDGGSLSLNGPVVNVSHHQMYVRPNLIPTNKMIVASQANTLIEQQQSIPKQSHELTYAELSLSMPLPNQRPIYTSATLGRPNRGKDLRFNEPTIYDQIDLARNPLSIQPNSIPTTASS